MSQRESLSRVESAIIGVMRHLRARALALSPCKRAPPGVRVRWISFAQVRQQRLAQAIALDPERKIFTDDFFKAIYERKRDQEKIYWAIVLFNVPISAALLLNAFSASSPISVLGVELSQISQLKEVLFFLLATVNIFAAIMFFDIADLTMMLEAGVKQATPAPLRTFVTRQYSDVIGKFPEPLGPNPWQFLPRPVLRLVFATFITLLGFFLIVWLAAAVFVQLVMFYDIWTKPSLSPIWGRFVVVYGVLVLLYWITAAFFTKAPLPYWDYAVIIKLNALYAKNPPAHARRMQAMIRLAQQPRQPLRRFQRAFKRRYLIKRQYKL